MTPVNKKGPGTPTHVLVDMLGHPAVELTQAEDAVGSNARDDVATRSTTGSEDVIALIIGICSGFAICICFLSIACFIKRRTSQRHFPTTTQAKDDITKNGNTIVTATPLSKTSSNELNISTSFVPSKENIERNGSVLGKNCSEFFGPSGIKYYLLFN